MAHDKLAKLANELGLKTKARKAHHATAHAPRTVAEESAEARELMLFGTNDSSLYHSREVPIIKNLQGKIASGKYDSEKSVALWKYWAEDAAKRYAKEFGGSGTWNVMFPPAARTEVARAMRDRFEAEQRTPTRRKG